MSFTLISIVIISVIALAITASAFRGHKKGAEKSILHLCTVLVSAVLSAILSPLIFAKMIAGYVLRNYLRSISEVKDMLNTLPHFESVATAIIAAAISAFLFVAFYVLCLIVIKIIVTILYYAIGRKGTVGVSFEKENAPWYVKRTRLIGAIVGGFTGFTVAILCLSPVVGTLKNAVKIFDIGVDMNLYERENEYEEVTEIRRYANDFGVNIVHYCGGDIFYRFSARARTDGNTVVIAREIDNIADLSEKVADAYTVVSNFAEIDQSDLDNIRDICHSLDRSYVERAFVADIVAAASGAWIKGETYMGTSFPINNETLEPLFDSLLSVYAETDPDTVAQDVETFINICSLAMSSGILESDLSFNEVMKVLGESGFVDNLNTLLEGNKRMKHVKENLYRFAMKSVVEYVKIDKFDTEKYETLLSDLTTQFNRLASGTGDMKVDTLANFTADYLKDYGVDVPDNVATLIADAMYENFDDIKDGVVTYDQMREFFESHLTGATVNGG
jgi:hypothetical protein